MESVPQETKAAINKKIIAPAIIICIIIGGLAWYFLYFIKTPEYSLSIIKDSVQKHDVVNFKKHVDLDALLSRGFDDLMAASMESDTTMNQQMKAMASGFIQMLKAPVTNAFKDGIIRFVETGKWEENQPATTDKQNPDLDTNKIADKAGIKKTEFKGVEYTKKDGKIAVVGIKIFDPEINKELVLDINMRELDDGTWQVSEISNLKDYFLVAEKTKKEAFEKYLADTKPIVDQHNKIIKDLIAELNVINKSSSDQSTKKAAIKSFINDKICPAFDERLLAIATIEVPPVAKELSDLRIKNSDLNKQALLKYSEWRENDNPQTRQEYKNLSEEVNKSGNQISDMEKNIAQQ